MASSSQSSNTPAGNSNEQRVGQPSQLAACKRLTRSAIRRAERAAASMVTHPHISTLSSPQVKPPKTLTKKAPTIQTKTNVSVDLEDTEATNNEMEHLPVSRHSTVFYASHNEISPAVKGRRSSTDDSATPNTPTTPKTEARRSVRSISEQFIIPSKKPVYTKVLTNFNRTKMVPRDERSVSATSTNTEEDLALAIDDMALYALTTSEPDVDDPDDLAGPAPLQSSTLATAPTQNPDTSSPPSSSSSSSLESEVAATVPTTNFHPSTTMSINPPRPPPFPENRTGTGFAQRVANDIWTTRSLNSSRPVCPWGWSKRWTCCRCGAETMVEQGVCARLLCVHERCERGCRVEWGNDEEHLTYWGR